MSGFPFPTSTHKWQGMSEAKHPLVLDLIKLWEESPGYILPQGSFISDRNKLEALIDSVIDMLKQKANMPVRAAAVAPRSSEFESKTLSEDPQWEKNLVKALSTSAITAKQSGPSISGLPSLPAMPALPNAAAAKVEQKLAGLNVPALPAAAEEKLAKLKMIEPAPVVTQSAEPMRYLSRHLIILYAVSASAFLLACYSLVRQN